MKQTAALLGAVSMVFLAGCVAGSYVAPAANSPQATLHILTDHPHRTVSGWFYYPDDQCSKPGSMILGTFSKLYDGQKNVQVLAGEKKYLLVKTSTNGLAMPYSCGGQTCISTDSCYLQFEVTPASGRRYLLKHSGTGQSCAVEITDESTGQVPTEIHQVQVNPSCMK